MEKEMEEDDEDEDEQLIRLFMAEEGRRRERRKRRTAAADVQEQHHHKELFALCRRHGCRRIAHARKHHTRTDNHEVQKAAKLHRQLAALQRRRRRQAADKKRVSVSDIFQDAIAMKMFMSVLDPEDILEDWNWNLDEAPSAVEEAEDWEWNMPKDDDNSAAIKQRYYDVPSVKDEFNDFNFWRTEAELVNLLPVAIEEDAWPLWKEWGSVDEILTNTLEAELLLAEAESGEEVQECPPPWTGRQEEFRLPMTRMAARGRSSSRRHLDEDDDHWSLWTEWGSVDEILDNTLVAGLADLDDNDALSAAAPGEQCPPEKDEDVDSGFLGDTEEDWGKWTMTATTTMTERQSFWQESYDNESILHSLVNDEMVEEAGGASGGEIGSYWDESRRDNHRILEALLHEEPPSAAGGRRTAARRKRKFREEEMESEDVDIVFEEDQEKEREAQSTFSGYVGGGHQQTHQFWEAFSKNKNNNNNNNAMFEESRADSDERDLCSCESGVFWLSTEDNRRIAENLVEEPAAAYWEASLENSKIARALVREVVGDSGATAEEEKRPRKEAEDYFKDWRRNLISPRKSR